MTERDVKLNNACDRLLELSAGDMQSLGAEPERIVDRMLTYGAAQIVCWHGGARAAEVLRTLADNVAAGSFARMDPTSLGKRN